MVLWAQFLRANIGEKIWNQLKKKYSAELYLLMPESDDDYNYYALLYLDKYMQKKNVSSATVIYQDSIIKQALPVFTKNMAIQSVCFSRFKMNCLLKYYALFEFSSKLTIISLKKPYDTYGENLLGYKGVTKEKLLCFDIYRFNEIPEVDKPVYSGTEQRIKNFVNR